MKKSIVFITVSFAALAMLSCAAGPNQLVGTPDAEGDVAGFWNGLWHGFIALFTFLISLFSDKVHMYDVHNSGNLYNLGYLIGVMVFFGGGCCGSRKRSRK